MRKTYIVEARWDDEARVWVASSPDLRGLNTESDTLDALLKKLDVMIPDLLCASGELDDGGDIPHAIK